MINENSRFAKFTETINGNKVDCMCIFPNNKIFVNLEDKRDNIDQCMFMDNISDIYDHYKYRTMIVTYNKDEGLEIDTDDEKYRTPHLYLLDSRQKMG